MKNILLTAFLFLFIALPARAETVRYSEAMEDLPLMATMQELPDSVVVFDTPNGRIVEMTAQTAASQEQIKKFYNNALPQLGWHTQAPHIYWRDGERLTVDMHVDGANTLVHFSLSPKKE